MEELVVIREDFAKSGQKRLLSGVYKYSTNAWGDYRLKVDLSIDVSYDHQSSYVCKVFNKETLQWNVIADLPHYAVDTDGAYNEYEPVLKKIRDELFRVVKEILT